MNISRLKLILAFSFLFLFAPFSAQANGLSSCEGLATYGTHLVITVDFEGITTVPGNVGAVNLVGDEFPGLTLTPDNGANGLWVGIPDATLGNNCFSFYASDFVPVSPVAVFSPDNCNLPGSPVGAVVVNFDFPVQALGLSFLDAEGAVSSITAYDGPDGTGNVLGYSSAQYQPDNSQAFRYVATSEENIQSAVIQLGGGGDGVGMDDLCFVDPDTDDDGIPNSVDLCPETFSTDPNVPTSRHGTNRWIWEGSDWVTNAKGVEKYFTIEETQGCSCEQILDVLVEKTDLPFDGHYKFGCSQSVVEDWISGLYYMETVEVPALDLAQAGVDSVMTLKSTENYQLMAYGVADALNADGRHIPFDAKYSVTTEVEDPAIDADWTDLVTLYEGFGEQLLDLHVNGAFINWGAFNPTHVYWHDMPGTNSSVNLWIYDTYPDNNDGYLYVDIFVELW